MKPYLNLEYGRKSFSVFFCFVLFFFNFDADAIKIALFHHIGLDYNNGTH